SDITSKESTLQVVYDVLRLTSFYKAFLVTTDVPEIYMQEFWATSTVHHHSIRFKINNKKRIVNLEYFREMLHICPRIPNQTFDELPFEEEILAFLRYIGHSGEIKKITDVNINKLHQPWRSFVAVINKCLNGKSTGHDNFVYQVEHKDAKKSNKMYYPRFTKVIINFFMTKDPSIPKRNKFDAMLPVELTKEDIRNSAAYKEYYAIASGAAPPKTKASVRKTQSSSNTTMTPPMATCIRLLTLAKGKQLAKSSKAKGLFVLSEVALNEAKQMKLATKRSLQQTHTSQASGSSADEGTGIIPGFPDAPTDESDEEISWKSSDEDDDDVDDQSKVDEQDDDDQDDNDDDQDSDNNGDDFVHPKLSTHDEEAKDEESFDPIVQTSSQVEKSDDESHGMNVRGDEGLDAEDDDEELVDVPVSTTFIPFLVTAPTLPPPSIPIMSQVQQVLTPIPITAPITSLQDLLNFSSLFGFDHRLKTLEANFFEFMQTNQFAEAVSSIPRIVGRYIDHRMNEAVKVAVQLQSDRLRDEAQAENEDFINKLDKNIQKIIKEQVKTSYVVAANQSELELKKILIEKIESNKSINQSDEQRNLYKALVDAYECDKIILDTYGDSVTLNRHTLTPKLLAGPTYELMKGSCKSPVELEFFLEEGISHWGYKCQQFYGFVVNKESAQDVYSKRRIIVVTELQIVEWHDYKHMDWITVRRDDDKLYKFKKGDFKRLRIQDIENMLLLLVQGKLTNLTIEERFAFNVSLRMFTRSIVIQRRVKDLQLGAESYQKKLNLTKLDTYMTYFNCKEAYIAYSNLRGFIYQNKDKHIRLIRIDEVHKFSDGTLNDVRTTLDDRLKGIRMKYLPQTIWRKSDKERAATMIQAIDKQLKTRRIMQSLEKFAGGRLYEGDFRMLQRTI
nr:hypothetical protein [Tanacetum cinerariifolium]